MFAQLPIRFVLFKSNQFVLLLIYIYIRPTQLILIASCMKHFPEIPNDTWISPGVIVLSSISRYHQYAMVCELCHWYHRYVSKPPWMRISFNQSNHGFSDWWFGTCFIFPYIGNNNPNWRTHIFQRGGSTTNQYMSPESHDFQHPGFEVTRFATLSLHRLSETQHKAARILAIWMEWTIFLP